MLMVQRISKRDGLWYLQGISEAFETREEAIHRARQLKSKPKERNTKFVSETLEMSFRSNWEVELAELLYELGIEFQYEPERFYFRAEQESYLPDFYLPQYNTWIEVKGYMDKRSLRRCKLFKKHYGADTGFFLYEEAERELIRESPELIYSFIEIAQNEQLREQNLRGK